MHDKTLCITLGDPCGLGPELVVRYFSEPREGKYLLVGPKAPLLRELEQYGVQSFYTVLEELSELAALSDGVYLYEPPQLSRLGYPRGEAAVEGGLAAGVSLEVAVELLQNGTVHALTTCPLNKAMLQQAGFDFPGHTEFLAERLGAGRENVCMHLCGEDEDGGNALRVSLVTTHPPLADVPGLVTGARIRHCLNLTAEFLNRLEKPGTIGVCGLNPHAGESGRIGHEDRDVVEPAVDAARRGGIDCEGPIPADTLFHFAAAGHYPAVLAMYHDQGLGPLKLLHFGRAVNVTLGLPVPRTSPDHGTGYDVCGTGEASIHSFAKAVEMARKLMG
ncbi:4-hydroxythreonine-4-phosphate dehydrogenase PdxA [Salidesulfovibrio brasiliensis]|uniref:4-hydroxythreonine-4-phosphate dehydrogenase PdxA n=1 Tax=Salidesulfovibrio brasiliensis TaxID=221711 RepID=UPI0006D1203B|nr:4-hydroxythreonine-4-phosphate dehydrogenase PdxA [Salidesulfovibrio brasiliensis]